MDRDYGKELDQLREDMNALKETLHCLTSLIQGQSAPSEAAKPSFENNLEAMKEVLLHQPDLIQGTPVPNAKTKSGEDRHFEKMNWMHPDEHIRGVLSNLEDKVVRDGCSGAITYVGTYEASGNQSIWIRNEVDIDPLLQQIEDRSAEKVLSCIGSGDRLRLLLALLKKPLTVQEMVKECGFNSTGQVYHHLRPLVAADLVAEEPHRTRGAYIIRPHRVSGLIMLLAGIHDLLDDEYTTAHYTEEE